MNIHSLFKTPRAPRPYVSTEEHFKLVVKRTPDIRFYGKSDNERAMLSCELLKARATIAAMVRSRAVNSEVNKTEQER